MKILRVCPICGSKNKLLKFKQNLVGEDLTYSNYDVVCCKKCDFVFADNTLDQEKIEHYYLSEYRHDSEIQNDYYAKLNIQESITDSYTSYWDLKCHENTLKNIKKFALPSDKILDIGCGTGNIIKNLQDNGYHNIEGIEPSRKLAEIANKINKVKVYNYTLSNFPSLKEVGKYDFIIISHVLEHVIDLESFINNIKQLNCFSDRRLIYIEVPDLQAFSLSTNPEKILCKVHADDIFVHFTPEHVNFFSRKSLKNLCCNFGLSQIFLESQISILGVVASVWKAPGIERDPESSSLLDKYIDEAYQQIKNPLDVLTSIKIAKTKIILWGVGLHTRRLLSLSDFQFDQIYAFIDSDPKYTNQSLLNIPIYSPDRIPFLPKFPILISTKKYQKEIVKQIKDLGYKNEIILLY